jgi:hypothetical protein
VAKYKIILFLEDNAQEVFIPALVERMIMDEGKVVNDYEFRILSSRGGGSIRAYMDFIKQAKKRRLLDADVLIVGSDGNCNGFLKRKQQLLNASKNIPYPEVITAVPDPHIERWYLLDGIALANAAGVPIQALSPKVKCDKNHFKSLLKKAFTDQNLFPPLGGAEYGALIAYSLDIYTAGTMDHSLRDFVDQVPIMRRNA